MKSYILLFIFLILVLLTGCWDMVPVEDRGFILGMAIDVPEDKKKINGHYELELTNQFGIPAALGVQTRGGSSEQAFLNLSKRGPTIYKIDQQLANESSKAPFFEHLKVLIISEEVMSVPNFFEELLDIFVRDPELRRGIKLLVSKDRAKNVLEIDPVEEKMPALFIEKMLRNNHIKKPVRVGDIQEHILKNDSFILPLATIHNGEVEIKGGAVYHGIKDRMIGHFTEKEMMGFKFITADNDDGTIEVELYNRLFTIELEKIKRKVKINAKNKNDIAIHVFIDVKGDIREVNGGGKLMNKNASKELERKVADHVEDLANKTIHKAQTEFQADVFGFKRNLEISHYDLWKEINDEWEAKENIFSQVPIEVAAHIDLLTTGSTERNKGEKRKGGPG